MAVHSPQTSSTSPASPDKSPPARRRRPIGGLLESKIPSRRSFDDYREFVRDHYDGIPGALTSLTGLVTGHEALAGRLIHPRGFDVRGCKRILDAACGNGRYSRFLMRRADPDASIFSFDYSLGMLTRARTRVGCERVSHVAADLTRLPYASAVFDAIVCGWVLEHLPDPLPGLKELSRVLCSGGKLLLLTTEDTFNGAVCSRLWHCRTYNRAELRKRCHECGLGWERELWFSRLHARLRLGGIIVQLRRR